MHDAKNRPLVVGDRVLLPATIVALAPTEDFYNVGIKLSLARRPDGEAETLAAMNTGAMLRANEGDVNDLDEAFNTPEP